MAFGQSFKQDSVTSSLWLPWEAVLTRAIYMTSRLLPKLTLARAKPHLRVGLAFEHTGFVLSCTYRGNFVC